MAYRAQNDRVKRDFINYMLDIRFNDPASYIAERDLPKRVPRGFRSPMELLCGIFPDFDFAYDKNILEIAQVPFTIFTENYSGEQILDSTDFELLRNFCHSALNYAPGPSLENRRDAYDSLGFTLDGYNALSMIFVLTRNMSNPCKLCISRDVAIRKRQSKFKYKFSYEPTENGGIFPVTLNPQDLAVHGQEIVLELIANGGKMYDEIRKIAFTKLPLKLIGE